MSRDKLKTLYLQYHNAYGHNTYQGDDIPQGTSINKFSWTLNGIVMWGHIKNLTHYISTCRRPMETKLGK